MANRFESRLTIHNPTKDRVGDETELAQHDTIRFFPDANNRFRYIEFVQDGRGRLLVRGHCPAAFAHDVNNNSYIVLLDKSIIDDGCL